jgi:hypothetical protein
MRAAILSLLLAAGLASAQEYLVTVVVETVTNKTCGRLPSPKTQKTTLTFDQTIPYKNTNGNLDRVVGLSLIGENESLCIPYNSDGSFTISTDETYWFGFGQEIHRSRPIKVDEIRCGQE